jgi:uncharacterized protein with HEPN domain
VRADQRRLTDISDAIQQIERYAAMGRAEFDSQELVQVWMLHHLEIIGEALRSMSPQFQSENRSRLDWAGWTRASERDRAPIFSG